MKQLTSRINMSVMRGTKRVVDGMTSYGLDNAFQVFDNVTGTPRYNKLGNGCSENRFN